MCKAVLAAWCAVALSPSMAQAQPLTYSQVIARARENAPRIVAARLAIEEARARVIGANVRPVNPELDGAVGRRNGAIESSIDLDVGLMHRFDVSGRRSARVAEAEAGVAMAQASVDETTRAVVLDAITAYLRVVRATERERLLASAENLANALHQTADRRYRAGDIAVLDVNVAKAALARVRADREAARGDATAARGDLAITLGIEGEVDIDPAIPAAPTADSAVLLRSALERPELRTIESGVREAEATTTLGRTFTKPELGAGARYARDEGDNIVSGVFTITLPFFSRGQELIATGNARASRLRTELDALKRRVQREVTTALAALERRQAALQILERDAVPAADENESLAGRSYEAGQIGLAEMLLIRREILETRFQVLDARLDAALARVELDAAAGVLR